MTTIKGNVLAWCLGLISFLMLTACAARVESELKGARENRLTFSGARQLLDQGQAIQAVAAFRALLREDPSDLGGLNGLAIAYSELGKTDLAAEIFARALVLSPDDPATLNNIGFSALRRAEPALARRYLERAGYRKDEHPEISGNLTRLDAVEIWLAKVETGIADVFEDPSAIRHLQIRGRKNGRGVFKSELTDMIDVTSLRDPFAYRWTNK